MGIALLCGAGLALQVGFNSALKERLGHPIPAALGSFGTGLLGLLIYALVIRPPWPDAAALSGGPGWIWLGGLVGACYIVAAASLATRLGAAGWLALIVAGQLLTSVLLDHFGLVGFPRHPVTPWRVAGATLLLIGVTIVLKS